MGTTMRGASTGGDLRVGSGATAGVPGSNDDEADLLGLRDLDTCDLGTKTVQWSPCPWSPERDAALLLGQQLLTQSLLRPAGPIVRRQNSATIEALSPSSGSPLAWGTYSASVAHLSQMWRHRQARRYLDTGEASSRFSPDLTPASSAAERDVAGALPHRVPARPPPRRALRNAGGPVEHGAARRRGSSTSSTSGSYEPPCDRPLTGVRSLKYS